VATARPFGVVWVGENAGSQPFDEFDRRDTRVGWLEGSRGCLGRGGSKDQDGWVVSYLDGCQPLVGGVNAQGEVPKDLLSCMPAMFNVVVDATRSGDAVFDGESKLSRHPLGFVVGKPTTLSTTPSARLRTRFSSSPKLRLSAQGP